MKQVSDASVDIYIYIIYIHVHPVLQNDVIVIV